MLEPGLNRLPIEFCNDDEPEQLAEIAIEFRLAATGEDVNEDVVWLRDDDFISVTGPRDLREGGYRSLVSREANRHEFEFGIPPWIQGGEFILGGVPFTSTTEETASFDCLLAPLDFVLLGPWQAGQGSIYTCGDDIPEPDVDFELVFVSASGVDRIPMRVIDDDQPPGVDPGQSATFAEPAFGAAPEVVTVRVEIEDPVPYLWQYRAIAGPVLLQGQPPRPDCTGGDVLGSLNELGFALPNADHIDIEITVCPDTGDDEDRTTSLLLTPPLRFSTWADVSILIIDDKPRVTGADVAVAEGDASATVTFEIETLSPGDLWARTSDGEADSPDDYTGFGSALQPYRVPLPAGDTGPVEVDIGLFDDDVVEDDESFEVELWTSLVGGTRLATATVTILDDDAAPVVDLLDMEIVEGTGFDPDHPDSPATFHDATLQVISGPARPYDLRLEYSAPGDTATPRLLGGPGCDPTQSTGIVDYVPEFGTINVPPIDDVDLNLPDRLAICRDRFVEDDETFTVTVLDEHDNVLDTATITIVNDDTLPIVETGDVTVNEHDGDAVVIFDITTPAYTPLFAQRVDGSATSGPVDPDFQNGLGRLPIPALPGQTGPVEFGTAIFDDDVVEDDESFEVELWTSLVGGTRLATATVTILDDDAAPVVDLLDMEIVEGTGFDPDHPDSPATFHDATLQVISGPARPYDLRLEYSAPGDTATPRLLGGPGCDPTQSTGIVDYVPEFGTINVPPIDDVDLNLPDRLAICRDRFVEDDETFTVTVLDEHDNVLDTATITIVNDDTLPIVETGDVTVNEHDGDAVVIFDITTPAYTPLFAQRVDGSATSGPVDPDFQNGLGRLPIPALPGQTGPVEFGTAIFDDDVVEDDESFEVELWTSLVGGTRLATATVTILDDDAAPVVDLLDMEIVEGTGFDPDHPDSPATFHDATLQVISGPARPYDLRLEYSAPGDTATPRLLGGPGCDPTQSTGIVDYVPEFGTINVPPIDDVDLNLPDRLAICRDRFVEDDETFTVTVLDEHDNVLDTATITIVNDDAPPSLRGIDRTFAELSAPTMDTDELKTTVVFEVTTPGAEIRLWPRATALTASEDDYRLLVDPLDPSILLTDGFANPIAIEVLVVNDVQPEPDETVEIALFDQPFGGNQVASATLTITDADRVYPLLGSPAPVTVTEDGLGTTVVFEIIEPPSSDVTVEVRWRPTTTDGTTAGTCGILGPGDDIYALLGPEVVRPNHIEIRVNVGGCPDLVLEPDRTIELVVATLGGTELAVAQVTVTDDDEPPVAVLRDVAVTEGDVTGPPFNPDFTSEETVVLDVLVAPERDYEVEVRTDGRGNAGLSVVNCAAVPGIPQADALAFSRVVTIPAGETGEIAFEKVLACRNDDFNVDRWFGIEVVDGPGESGGVFDRARVDIVDDDDSIPGVSISDGVVIEGDDGQVFAELEISVTGGSVPTGVSWNALTLAGGSRAAASSSDFAGSTANVLTFPVGGGTTTITVPVNGDTIAEGDEFFRVTITSTGNVADNTGIVRIVDDDALRVSVSDAPAVTEGDAGTVNMMFTVWLDSQPSGTVQVFWETNGIGGVPQPNDPDMATGVGPARDFDATSGSLTFGADGSLAQQVIVQVRGDDLDEFTENVYLLLRGVSGGGDPVIGDGDGVGRIIDDDDLPSRPDTDPPIFLGVADIDVTIPSGQTSVLVSWNIRADDVVDGVVDHACTPAPKTSFAAGQTRVECGAEDTAGNRASTSFLVDVAGAADQRLTDEDGVSTGRATRGQPVIIEASGFLPRSQVAAQLRSDPIELAVLTADENGEVVAIITIPAAAELGSHTIALQGISVTGGVRNALFPVEIVDDGPVCTIVGTDGNDWLRGTRGDDVICGLGGDDRIFGRGGNDILIGGPGDDRIYGGNSADVIEGGAGDDRLHGGRGNDEIGGGEGDDRLFGGHGRDTLIGGDGDDALRGGSGNDHLEGGPGDDLIRGDHGRDVLIGGPGDDDIRGGPGDDTITP